MKNLSLLTGLSLICLLAAPLSGMSMAGNGDACTESDLLKIGTTESIYKDDCEPKLSIFEMEGDIYEIKYDNTGWSRLDASSLRTIKTRPLENIGSAKVSDIVDSVRKDAQGFSSMAVQSNGLTYIQGARNKYLDERYDVYIRGDQDGYVDLIIYCKMTSNIAENGSCMMGFDAQEIGLNLVVPINLKDIDNYLKIEESAKKVVHPPLPQNG